MGEDLDLLLKDAVARYNAMSPDEQKEMCRAQRESWVRAEMSWPAPKFHWENGTKVYESYEDYVNG